VHDSRAVCVRQSPRDVDEHANGTPWIEAGLTGAAKDGVQRATFQVFHHQKGLAIVPAHVEKLHDVLVIQPRAGLRFVVNALERLRRGELLVGEKLDGHGSFEDRVEGQKHHGHPTAPQSLEQLEPAAIRPTKTLA